MEGYFSERVINLRKQSEEKYRMFLDWTMNPKNRTKYDIVITENSIEINFKNQSFSPRVTVSTPENY